jgi:hypothetical protein
MKRILITLFVLVVLGGVVFFFGWVQIRIPPDAHAVIFTKTHGWEEKVIAPGTFVWRWQRLLPTNLTLYVFELSPHRSSVSLSGSLPSAEVFESILGSPASFSYDLVMNVTTQIRPEQLPTLAEEAGLRPEGLDQFYADLDLQITQIATDALLALMQEDPDTLTFGTSYTAIAEQVRSRLQTALPDLSVDSVAPSRIRLPDMELYTATRALSDEILSARAGALEQAAEASAAEQERMDRELQTLERYGEILDRYPVLLDYFSLGQSLDIDPLNLGELIPQPPQ